MIEYIGNGHVQILTRPDESNPNQEIRTYGIIVDESQFSMVVRYFNPLPPNNVITQTFLK